MVAIKVNEETVTSKKAKSFISHYREKVPERSEMMINIVYNVFCTPVALGLLFYFSTTESIWAQVSKGYPGLLLGLSIVVLLVAIWGSQLIIWIVFSILTTLGLPITREQNTKQVIKMFLVFLMAEPAIAVPRQPHRDDASFERFKTRLRILDVVAVVVDIPICLAIFFSTAFQNVLSNMYEGYKVTISGYMIMYVFGLTFWVRQYIRAKVEARCGQACNCCPQAEVEH